MELYRLQQHDCSKERKQVAMAFLQDKIPFRLAMRREREEGAHHVIIIKINAQLLDLIRLQQNLKVNF